MLYKSVKDLCKTSKGTKPNGGIIVVTKVNKLDDWLSNKSKELNGKNGSSTEQRIIKDLIDHDFTGEFSDLIPENFSRRDWLIQYYKHQENKNLDGIICELLDYAMDTFYEWWSLYAHSVTINDPKLAALMIKKMKSIKERSLWTEVFQDLKKKKEIENNPLMEAVKDMEALFGHAYYDHTDDDYIHTPTVDNGFMNQDLEYDSENYRYDYNV